ncbi:MAG: aldehyde ferredoxin oxidoreductase N-terminal domain-containing protein [Dehalococcoidales bacterium]|nr:aldehyde ferredoxin oxidoreductase N-terminal domain-containing protein [Dehalococcoidales bacterium]
MSKILRIDMTNLKTSVEDSPPEYELLGGRGLTARILNQEVSPACHPLGKHNKIILAPGLLASSRFPSSGRLSAGFKSPLTQGIKESNVGGTAGQKLGRLGIKAIILEGQPTDDGLYLLKVTANGAAILPANNLAGLTTYAVTKALQDVHGDSVSVLSIGPPGERKASMATIACTDMNGMPSRQLARGGPGAVMGSKGIKAIVIDDTGAAPVAAQRREAFSEIVADYAKFMEENRGAGLVRNYGQMGGLLYLSDRNHSLPVRNFTAGTFEGASKIGGKDTIVFLTSQGSQWGLPCMSGCIQCCSNIVRDKEGNYITSGLEYETSALLGANLGIDDIYAIANMSRLDDAYGLDDIEMGVTLGVAVAAGLMDFGDSARAIDLINEIGQGTTLGRILGEGAAVTGRAFGISRVPVIKGQAIPAHDPRVENGTGVTYCTSAMSDHTAGPLIFRQPSSSEAVKASRQAQIDVAIIDNLGLCYIAVFERTYPIEKVTAIVNAQYGLDLKLEDMQNVGKAILKEERAFNLNAGIGPSADRLPDFFKEELLPPSNLVFDVTDGDIDSFWNF